MYDHAQEATLTEETLAALQRFNDAFARHDVDAGMAALTADCVSENTYPPSDGERYAGQAAVRACWEQFFAASPHATFTTEESFAANDRAVVRWRYTWVELDGKRGHIRGVDLFRI